MIFNCPRPRCDTEILIIWPIREELPKTVECPTCHKSVPVPVQKPVNLTQAEWDRQHRLTQPDWDRLQKKYQKSGQKVDRNTEIRRYYLEQVQPLNTVQSILANHGSFSFRCVP